MKGELYERLRVTLRRAIQERDSTHESPTQESLGKAIGKTQRSVGTFLDGSGGALDLDEAAKALEHIGSSLPDFLAGLPPREMSRTERMARALVTRPQLMDLVEDLLPVRQKKLSDVIELARQLGRVASQRREAGTAESHSEHRTARRTTRGVRQRR